MRPRVPRMGLTLAMAPVRPGRVRAVAAGPHPSGQLSSLNVPP